MEAVKVNSDVTETSPSEAGFFNRRIGGTLFKVRVYTGSGYADTLDEKISWLIRNEVMTGGGNCGMMHNRCLYSFPKKYYIRKHHQMGGNEKLFKSVGRPHKQKDCRIK